MSDFVSDAALSAIKTVLETVLEWLRKGRIFRGEAVLLRLSRQVLRAKCSADIVYVVRQIREFEASIVSFCNVWYEAQHGKPLFADNIPVPVKELMARGIVIYDNVFPRSLQQAIEIAATSYDARETCREVYSIEWWADHGEPVVVEFSDDWAAPIYEAVRLRYKGWPPAVTPPTSSESETEQASEQVAEPDCGGTSDPSPDTPPKEEEGREEEPSTVTVAEQTDVRVGEPEEEFPAEQGGFLSRNGGAYAEDLTKICSEPSKKLPTQEPEEYFGEPFPIARGGVLARTGGSGGESLDELYAKSPQLFPEWAPKQKGKMALNIPVEPKEVKKINVVAQSTGAKPKLYLREGKEEKVGKIGYAQPCATTRGWGWATREWIKSTAETWDHAWSRCGESKTTTAYVQRSNVSGGELEAEDPEAPNICSGTTWESICGSSRKLVLRVFEEFVGLEDRVDFSHNNPVRQCVEGLVAPELPTVYQLASSGEYPACGEESCGVADMVNKVSLQIVSVAERDAKFHSPILRKESLGDKTELASSGDLPGSDGGGNQAADVAPVTRRQRRNRKSRAARRRNADSGSSSEADLVVYESVAGPSDNAEKRSPEGNVRKRGPKKTKSKSSGENQGHRGSDNDRDDTNTARVGRPKDVHKTSKSNLENVQLHEGRKNGVVGRSGDVPPSKVATTEVGCDTAGLLTRESATTESQLQGGSKLQDANGDAKPGKLPDEQKKSDEVRMASPSLADRNSQQLRSQRGEESAGSSSDELSGTGVSSDGSDGSSDRSDGKVDASTSPLRRFGGVDMLFSAAEEEVISETGSFTFNRTIRIQGRHYQVFCKVREVEDPGKRRRSKNDSGKKSKVQPDVRDVHKSDRTQPVSSNGPSSGENGSAVTNGRKRSKLVPTGETPKKDVGPDGKPGSDQSGFKQVGPARKRGHAQTNAPIVSKNDAGSNVEAPVELPARKQSDNAKRGKVQNKGRRHEWRYDNGSGQLHCRDCNTAGITRLANRLCYGARLNYIRRVHNSDSDLSPSSRVVRYKCLRAEDGSGKPVDDVLRRRGRSRDAGRETASGSSGSTTPTVVEGNGSRVEGGRVGGTVSSDTVLPTQTTSDSPRMGDDAGSKQSVGYRIFSDLSVSEKSKKLLGNAMDGKMPSPFGDSDTGTSVPSSSETTGSGGEAEGGGVQTHTKRSGDEHKSRKTYAGAAKAPANNGRAKDNGNGSVESNPGPTGKDGGNRNRDAKSKKAPAKGGVERRRTRDYANIRFIEGDIFSPWTHAVAHCVGADFRMGAGVAKGFVAKFGRPVIDSSKAVCGSVHLQTAKDVLGSLTLLHMVTKPLSSVPAVKEPKSYIHLERCLKVVAKHVKETMGKKEVAIPNLIGCGLDGMDRSKVLNILQRVGTHYNVTWVVYKNPTPRA